jgi:hypothetical protein
MGSHGLFYNVPKPDGQERGMYGSMLRIIPRTRNPSIHSIPAQ